MLQLYVMVYKVVFRFTSANDKHVSTRVFLFSYLSGSEAHFLLKGVSILEATYSVLFLFVCFCVCTGRFKACM